MEIMVRCALADRPGTLAQLAGAIASAGGDIQAVEVIDHVDGQAIDDLVIVVPHGALDGLVAAIRSVPDIAVVHIGPSRGHPGDAYSRLAFTVGAMLDGTMSADHAVSALLGGPLRATEVTVLPPGESAQPDPKTLVMPYQGGALVIRRDYQFTDTERQRAQAVVDLLEIATVLAATASAT